MKKCLFIVFMTLLFDSSFVFSAATDDILGLWSTEKSDARIRIYKCKTKYCGKIVWLKEPTYPAGSKEGIPGSPILDKNNPNPKSRKNTLIGVQILADFVFTGDDSWKNGKIYNSKNGKIYKGNMTLISPDHLNVRGFIGTSLIGGSTTWSRMKSVTK